MADPTITPAVALDVELDMPARRRVIAVPVPTLTTKAVVYSGCGQLVGVSLLETTGAAVATAELYDSNNTTVSPTPSNSSLVGIVNLASGGSTPGIGGFDGPDLRQGLVINVTTGSVRGVAWIKLPADQDVD